MNITEKDYLDYFVQLYAAQSKKGVFLLRDIVKEVKNELEFIMLMHEVVIIKDEAKPQIGVLNVEPREEDKQSKEEPKKVHKVSTITKPVAKTVKKVDKSTK